MSPIGKQIRYGDTKLDTPIEDLSRPARTIYPSLIDAEEDTPLIWYVYSKAYDLHPADQDDAITLWSRKISEQLKEGLELFSEGYTLEEAYETAYRSSERDHNIERFAPLTGDDGTLAARYQSGMDELVDDL